MASVNAAAVTRHQKNASTLASVEFKALHETFYGDETSGRLRAKSLHRNPIEGHEDIDRIERYLHHLEYCCKIYSGFDIYQLLAFRRLHEPSRQYTKTKPFKLLGFNYEIEIHSQFSDAILTAVIIGLLQVVGISVILYETVNGYFNDDNESDRSGCEYDFESWNEDGFFKILAMLFAAMISIQLNKTIQVQRHSGFNEILSSVPEKDFGKLHFIDIALIQFGLLINVYTLFCAVSGSFFLIYASEGGSDALDMVLNSITLFFMVGLDDLLVSANDYEDVEDYIMEFYKMYMDSKSKDLVEDDIDVQVCGYRGLYVCDRIVDVIQFILVSLTYTGGIIGPFAIAICW